MGIFTKRTVAAMLAACLMLSAVLVGVDYVAQDKNYTNLQDLTVEYQDAQESADNENVWLSTQSSISNFVITLEGNASALKVGQQLQLFPNCDAQEPNITYTYESLTPETASVDENGLVEGMSVGDARIQVTVLSDSTVLGDEEVTLAVVSDDTPVSSISDNTSFTNPSGAYITVPILTDRTESDATTVTYAKTGNTWEYYYKNYNKTPAYISGNCLKSYVSGVGNFLALKVRISTPGQYLMTQNHQVQNNGCDASIYILPGDTATSAISGQLTDANKAGDMTFRDATVTGNRAVTSKTKIGIVNFPTAGEYLFVYKVTKKYGTATPAMYIANILLDGVNCLKTVTPEQSIVDLAINPSTNSTYSYGTHQLRQTLTRLDGTLVKASDCVVDYICYDDEVATVDSNGMITARGPGSTKIEVQAYDGQGTAKCTIVVNVTDNTGIAESYIDMDPDMYVSETAQVPLTIRFNSGGVYTIPSTQVVLTVSNPDLLSIQTGTVKALAEGSAVIKATGTYLDQTVSAKLTLTATQHPGKTAPTYYTYEMRNIAQENIKAYSWARTSRNNAVAAADSYIPYLEQYYNLIPHEGIPRARQIGFKNDTKYGLCRYCGSDVVGKYGGAGVGGFTIDPINHPWKMQCPDCDRWFPSNDFASFYQLGLDDQGVFDYDKAIAENEKLVQSGHKGYLVNELYPEKGESWGVDDGFGYRVYEDGGVNKPYVVGDSTLSRNGDSSLYIAYYLNRFWYTMRTMVSNLSAAYLYTGDIQYARAGAVLLDRIADVTPGYDTFRNQNANQEPVDFVITCGGTGYGVFIGRIEDNLFFNTFSAAADSFFPALNDPRLIRDLSRRAKQLGHENDRSTSAKIWEYWKQNIVIEAYTSACAGQTKGNYGMVQKSVAIAAVVLAEEPMTTEWYKWIWDYDPTYGNSNYRTMEAGHLSAILFTSVSRDGMGNEGSPNYNGGWIESLYPVADILSEYQSDAILDPYQHPRLVNMFLNYDILVLSDSHHAQIGDSGSVAGLAFETTTSMYPSIWKRLKDTPLATRLAQDIYVRMKGNVSSLRYGIFERDPESLQKEILALVDKYARKEGGMLPGFGYSVLRDGVTDKKNTLRSVWMYYGITSGHGHQDTLNLGIEAFGLNLAPDLGYPANTINDPTNGGWLRTTLAHNTVVVNETSQRKDTKVQTPYLQDDTNFVDAMGVETKQVYLDVEEYKRTVIMVNVDWENSYTVDFFRVIGGSQHTYSFHSQSHNATAVSGLNLVKQTDENGNYVGTYAGADVAKGASSAAPLGYNYLTKVRKDTNVQGNQFTVDFDVTDYRNAISKNYDIHLKMTQITNFIPDEVAIAGGHVPVKSDNAAVTKVTDTLDYVLTQRKSADGTALDSMFTTVFEPYNKESYLSTIEPVAVTVVSGTPGAKDITSALKITHKNGFVDYVFYASNNEVTYRVANLFNVRGYVAVLRVNGNTGRQMYRYVSGGDIIVDSTGTTGVYKGTVTGYSKELTLLDNYIDIDLTMSQEELDTLAGRYIYVENGSTLNAVYKIEYATAIDGGVRLNLGTDSVIRSLRDITDPDGGYIYNISRGQRFEIPMSFNDRPEAFLYEFGMEKDVYFVH